MDEGNRGIKEIFSSRISMLLKQLNISQSKLAEMIGVRQSTISSWVNIKDRAGKENNALPNAAALADIAVALNTSIDYLLGLSAVSSKSETEQPTRDREMTYSDVLTAFKSLIAGSAIPAQITTETSPVVNAHVTLHDGIIVFLLDSMTKMTDLLNEGMITEDIFNGWYENVLSKFNIPIIHDSDKYQAFEELYAKLKSSQLTEGDAIQRALRETMGEYLPF